MNRKVGSELPPRILIVDDLAEHRDLVRYTLRFLGATDILEAQDGGQAVLLASQEPVDLVIMDLHMPRLDGWEAIRRIRALPGPAGTVPIIAHSADVTPRAQQRAFAAGCTAYLPKPTFDREVFAATIRQCLAAQERRIPTDDETP